MSADVSSIDRQQIEKFLTTCIDVMTSEATRKSLKEPSSGRPGKQIVEIQKQVWDDLGIPTDVGRLAISRIKETFPEDHADLLRLKDTFAKTADSTYLQCLEDRRPSVLKKKGKLSRNTVLEFLDACNVKMETLEVQERLRRHIEDTGSMPEAVINEIHGEVMELLGFEREYGQRCFRELGESKEFANDREMAMSFARWRGKNSSACLTILHEHRKQGGALAVDEAVRSKLMEMQAKEEIDSMTPEDRSKLLEKNVNRVNVFHGLPPEGRARYLERLGEEEKLELFKSEILIANLVQSEQWQRSRLQQVPE